MNEFRKKKLFDYLYPTQEIYNFMKYDLYVELSCLLEKSICFSNVNKNKTAREANLKKAKTIIGDFLNDNNLYKARINEFFPSFKFERLVEEILWGYVAFITPHINSYSGADVFLDKRSVCYTKFSIIDFL